MWVAGVCLALCEWAGAASAEEPQPPPRPSTSGEVVALPDAKTPPADPASAPLPDPTLPTGKLKELLTPKPVEKVGAFAVAKPKLPDLVLRAYFKAGDKAATAILESDGKHLYTVREGASFTVHTADGRNLSVMSVKVAADAIELEIPELKERVLVR
jgi:hypothetical protein